MTPKSQSFQPTQVSFLVCILHPHGFASAVYPWIQVEGIAHFWERTWRDMRRLFKHQLRGVLLIHLTSRPLILLSVAGNCSPSSRRGLIGEGQPQGDWMHIFKHIIEPPSYLLHVFYSRIVSPTHLFPRSYWLVGETEHLSYRMFYILNLSLCFPVVQFHLHLCPLLPVR